MPRFAFLVGAARVLALLCAFPGIAQSQSATATPGRDNVFNNHLWISLLHNSRFTDRWSLGLEGHWRRADLGTAWQQLLVRPTLNLHLNETVIFGAGYSFYRNYPYEEKAFPFPFNEHHAFEQMQLLHGSGRVRFAHRFRLEQRFIETYTGDSITGPVKGSNRYLNRFRYRFGFTIPLNKEAMEPGTFFIGAYDEVFLTFGDDSRIDAIQQNRISGLLGFQLDRIGSSIQLGYLYQTIMFPRKPVVNPAGAGGLTDDLMEHNRTVHLIFTLNLDYRSGKAFVPWIPKKGSRTIKTPDVRTRKP